jgi:hypothetical protein
MACAWRKTSFATRKPPESWSADYTLWIKVNPDPQAVAVPPTAQHIRSSHSI